MIYQIQINSTKLFGAMTLSSIMTFHLKCLNCLGEIQISLVVSFQGRRSFKRGLEV